MINLTLGEENFQIIKFNQYDKNYTFKIKLVNYTPVQGDIIKIEWEINNKVAVIQSDYITVNDNVLTVKLLREVTLNAGKGYFNVVVENTKDTSRRATFKSEFEVVGNSINEDTVSSVLVETVVEKLQNEEINAKKVLTNLLKAISDGSLNNYLLKSGGNVTGNILFDNSKGVRIKDSNGASQSAIALNSNNNLVVGNVFSKLFLYTNSEPLLKIGDGGANSKLYHEGNFILLLNKFYPVGSVKLTINNVNPSTTIGGTWTLIAQGQAIVGVGTGTDKNGVSKTFVAGANEGEYEHKLLATETFIKKASEEGAGYGLQDGGIGFTNRCYVSRDENNQVAFNITNPTFGVYIWKRTA